MTEKLLFVQLIVLIAGTVFAWYQWIKVLTEHKRCSANPASCATCIPEKPFQSKCFYGAVFFTIALGLNILVFYL